MSDTSDDARERRTQEGAPESSSGTSSEVAKPVAGMKATAVSGAAFGVSAQLSRSVFRMLTLAVLARLLSEEDYGLAEIALAFNAFGMIFRDLGLVQASMRAPNLTHEQSSGLFWINVSLATVCSLLVVVVAVALQVWGGPESREAGQLVLVLAPTALVASLGGQPIVHLSRQLRFKTLAIVQSVPSFAGPLVAICIALAGGGVWALIAQHWVVFLLEAVLAWLASGWRPLRPQRPRAIGSIVRHGLWMTISEFFYMGQLKAQRLIIGFVLGTAVLGNFGRAMTLLEMPGKNLFTPIARVLIPSLARLQHEPQRFAQAALRVARSLDTIMAPILAVGISVGDHFVRILLSAKWVEAAQIFPVLVASLLGLGSSLQAHWMLVTLGFGRRQTVLTAASSIVELLFVVSGLLLAQEFGWAGIVGVACGYAISKLVMRIPLLFFALRPSPVSIREFMRTIFFPNFSVVCGVACAFVTLFFLRDADEWIRLVVGGGVAFGVSLGLILARRDTRLGLVEILTAVGKKYSRRNRDVEEANKAPGDQSA